MSEQVQSKQMRVAFFPFDGTPELRQIGHGLEAMQALVEGLICPFPTRVPGVIGFCNDESIEIWDLNLFSVLVGTPVCGPFFLCREVMTRDGWEHESLTDEDLISLEFDEILELQQPATPIITEADFQN
ncbi:DUF3846 domain-containing protein [bacterium]|nr:MAG: DUF3846 domain-containing protein [bacterium]